MEYIPVTAIVPEISDAVRQAFLDNMDKEYCLIYTDYNDNFDNSQETIQECLNKKNAEALDNLLWLGDSEHIASLDALEELKDKILSGKEYRKLHSYIDEWLDDDDNKDFITGTIKERDASTPVAEMVSRTKLYGRVTLYTNYDCLADNYSMCNAYYYDEYFKDIVDVLCLNPANVKKAFNAKGINTTGRWPDKRKRNGREAVSYEDLAIEMRNQCCYGLLTFMGMMPLSDLYKHNFEEYKAIVIPKGNNCGMFSHWNGGGSLMEMKLLRDLSVPVTFPRKTQYDRCELCVDEPDCGNGYCINDVYGLLSSAWGEEFKLIYKSSNK